MCTLAVALRARAEVTLAVTANRDEHYDRPATPPRVERGVLDAIVCRLEVRRRLLERR